MEPEQRYQIVATIGAGEFATVYRARDLELGRDVAIKQIHYQYLQDPRQLDRYWHEAQVLANLHHQHIMSIFDIVRPRGWMILELMRGSLPGELQGRPVDIETLKLALMQSLHALDFLHTHRVVHGDIKPSNLLISLHNRLKLGDFGLARRAGGGEGSLLKGTPKYMAPEVMSEQFGPVGPASDLYSLGFTCYELLCGAHFESLFPGLNSFGRDKAVAWMMWHSAADRRLPPIQKVLEGVPDNIAAVIERLIVKDQAGRFQTAAQVLAELKERPFTPGPTAADVETEEAVAKAKRKRRLAIGAFAASAIVSIGLAFLPTGSGPQPLKPEAAASQDVRSGNIRDLFVDERKIVFVVPEDRRPLEIAVPDDCNIQLNGDRFLLLREVERGDDVRVTLAHTPGQPLTAKAIDVIRPEVLEGSFREADAKKSLVILEVSAAGGGKERRIVQVPEEVKPRLNGERLYNGKPLSIERFQPGDRVVARYFLHGDRRDAVSVDGYRVVSLTGTLKQLNVDQRRIMVTADGKELEFPLKADCAVTLDGDFASLRDLAPGDEVTIDHDAEAVGIAARRTAVAAEMP